MSSMNKGKESEVPMGRFISTQPGDGGDDDMNEHSDVDVDIDADTHDDQDALMIDSNVDTPGNNTLIPTDTHTTTSNATTTGSSSTLQFPALPSHSTKTSPLLRRIPVPPHRMTPLKKDWIKIYTPLVQECKLQVRMNVKRRAVEVKTSKHTVQPVSPTLQKAVDFLEAYTLGFAADDAIALVRMDDLYIETFEIKDVKTLHGDHLSRAIGRIAGKDGKTRFTIENASRTRIVLAESKIHILGTFSAIKMARDAVCALILGSPPSKVYGNLKTVAARSRQRF